MIKLVNHPYKDYEVGETIELSEAKEKSLVELQRAVFVEGEAPKEEKEEKPKKKSKKKKKDE